MKEYGQASLDVVVQPGEVVPVFYAVPWHQFSRGSIGHEQQKRKGGALAVSRVLIGPRCHPARGLDSRCRCDPVPSRQPAGLQPDAGPVTPTRWCPAACS